MRKPDKKYLGGGLLLLAATLIIVFFQVQNKTSSAPGSLIYEKQCAACHGRDGNGLRALYPPLKDSHYLHAGVAEFPCLVRGGIRGPFTGADGTFNQRMPAFRQLTGEDIMQLMVYLKTRWGKAKHDTSLETVEQWLMSCP